MHGGNKQTAAGHQLSCLSASCFPDYNHYKNTKIKIKIKKKEKGPVPEPIESLDSQFKIQFPFPFTYYVYRPRLSYNQ